MEEELPDSYWNRHFVYEFAFPTHSASAKTARCVLDGALCTIMVLHTELLLVKGPTSE